ncbi:MAG: hypothetical protein M1450_05035 [Patescibacteria group bacterium]|nr:hypothetical protein [Patescibacteria group bacterium]
MEENTLQQNQEQIAQQSVKPIQNQSPLPANKSKLPILIIIFVLLVVVGSGTYYYLGLKKTSNIKACPEVARVCKDGLAAKQGPNCTQTCPENSISPPPTFDETASPAPNGVGANWKTYTSDKFSFRYPSNGTIEVSKSKSFITGNEGNLIYIKAPPNTQYEKNYIFQIEIEENIKNLNTKGVIDDYINRLKINKDGPGMKETADKISKTIKVYTNNNIDGLIGTYGWETEFALVVEVKNNKIYSFSIHDGNGYTNEYVLKLFDQILSTFKFTNP